MCGKQLLAGQDEEEEAHGEEKCGEEVEERGIFRLERGRPGLDHLDEHRAEAELSLACTKVKLTIQPAIHALKKETWYACCALVRPTLMKTGVSGVRAGRRTLGDLDGC